MFKVLHSAPRREREKIEGKREKDERGKVIFSRAKDLIKEDEI